MIFKLAPCSLLLACALAAAQSTAPGTMPSLPIPTQLASAKSVFIAFAGANSGGPSETEVTPPLLAGVQAALSSSGRYTIVAKPADAELSMRLSVESTFTTVSSGTSSIYFYIRLAIFDTKTGMLLWTINEPIDPANRKATFFKNLDAATERVVKHLDSLAAGKLP